MSTEKNPAGGQPRELYECDLDIIGPPSSRSVHDAEVIKIVSEVLYEFSPQLGGFIIKVNHFKILKAILSACEFPAVTHARVFPALEKYWRNRQAGSTAPSASTSAPFGLRTALSKSLLAIKGVTQKSLELLQQFQPDSDDPEKILGKLERMLSRNREAVDGIGDLRQVIHYLKMFGIVDKVRVDPLLASDSSTHDGTIFRAILLRQPEEEVIAVGGRYDSLIARFQPPNSTSPAIAAVGVNIAVAKIVTFYIAYHQRIAKDEGKKLRSCETEVFLCCMGTTMLDDLLEIAAELWSHGIKTEYMDGGKRTLEEIAGSCKHAGIDWMVVVRERAYKSGRMLKVKHVHTRAETEIHRDELAQFLLNNLRHAAPMVTPVSSKHAVTTESHTPPSERSQVVPEVVFLPSGPTARKRPGIATAAIKALSSRVSGAIAPGRARILALDLPHHVIKDMVKSGESHQLVQRYPRFRQTLTEVREYITSELPASVAFLFLYSIPDGKYETLVLK